MLTPKEQHTLNEYVMRYTGYQTFEPYVDTITNMIKTNGDIMNTTLFRGTPSSQVRPRPWFSCSKSKDVAISGFSDTNCCLLIIHLVDVKGFDIYQKCEQNIININEPLCKSSRLEEEVLVLGGGHFYKDKNFTEKGFNQIEPTIIPEHTITIQNQIFTIPERHVDTFESWYTMEPLVSGGRNKPKKIKIKRTNRNMRKTKSKRKRKYNYSN